MTRWSHAATTPSPPSSKLSTRCYCCYEVTNGKQTMCKNTVTPNFHPWPWHCVTGTGCQLIHGKTVNCGAINSTKRWQASASGMLTLYDQLNKATSSTLRSPSDIYVGVEIVNLLVLARFTTFCCECIRQRSGYNCYLYFVSCVYETVWYCYHLWIILLVMSWLNGMIAVRVLTVIWKRNIRQ